MKMNKLSTEDREVYRKLIDPSNEIMNQIRYGTEEQLQKVY